MSRLARAWRALQGEQRLVALAALGMFASMFLPWYDKTDTLVVHGAVKATQTSLSAFAAFSFVEAAVLLVSAGVLAMLFARAEDRAFKLPGGDGAVVVLAGGWSALLIFYRLLDKPGLQGNERVTATVGVEWGIFVALLLAIAVAYAGWRMRAAERPEPPLRSRRPRPPRPAAERAGDADSQVAVRAAVPARPHRERAGAAAEGASATARPRYPPAPDPPAPEPEQLSFEHEPGGFER